MNWSRRAQPQPSPPWGLTARKQIKVNASFQLEPLQMVPTTNGNSILLCLVTPASLRGPWLTNRNNKLKTSRLNETKLRRQNSKQKFLRASNFASKQKQLKRLQRCPIFKRIKAEIKEKWEKKRNRQQFKRRKQFKNIFLQLVESDSKVTPHGLISFPEVTKCNLWYCRRNRKVGHHSRSPLSNTHPRSEKSRSRSRSPIRIRSSSLLSLLN